jgi:hypothetical protein
MKIHIVVSGYSEVTFHFILASSHSLSLLRLSRIHNPDGIHTETNVGL